VREKAEKKVPMPLMQHVHCSGGAFVGGDWIDIEDCAEHFSITNGSGSCGGPPPPRSRSRTSAARPDGTYDVVIIGAGAIGAAIARTLSKTKASVLLLDAADDVTQGATKGNSGIVHAGYDDAPGSIKAKYCWPGNQLFPELDRELHFGFEKNGSLVVAKSAEDMKLLDELMERGRINGVENLTIIDQAELRRLEPYIHPDAIGALRSPDAGTITPYEYTIALAENAVDNGVELRLRREVVGISSPHSGGFAISAKHWETTAYAADKAAARARRLALLFSPFATLLCAFLVKHWDDQQPEDSPANVRLVRYVAGSLVGTLLAFLLARKVYTNKSRYAYSPSAGTVLRGVNEEETILCDFIVNAAGCGSDVIAAMVGDTSFTVKRRHGEYILLHKDEGKKVRHTLFPCPDPLYGKGVLVQGTLWGNLVLGPTARDSMRWNKEASRYEEDPDVRDEKSKDILAYILGERLECVPSFQSCSLVTNPSTPLLVSCSEMQAPRPLVRCAESDSLLFGREGEEHDRGVANRSRPKRTALHQRGIDRQSRYRRITRDRARCRADARRCGLRRGGDGR
jgi:L-2-hydroxyglutarate oxidase LhgO